MLRASRAFNADVNDWDSVFCVFDPNQSIVSSAQAYDGSYSFSGDSCDVRYNVLTGILTDQLGVLGGGGVYLYGTVTVELRFLSKSGPYSFKTASRSSNSNWAFKPFGSMVTLGSESSYVDVIEFALIHTGYADSFEICDSSGTPAPTPSPTTPSPTVLTSNCPLLRDSRAFNADVNDWDFNDCILSTAQAYDGSYSFSGDACSVRYNVLTGMLSDQLGALGGGGVYLYGDVKVEVRFLSNGAYSFKTASRSSNSNWAFIPFGSMFTLGSPSSYVDVIEFALTYTGYADGFELCDSSGTPSPVSLR